MSYVAKCNKQGLAKLSCQLTAYTGKHLLCFNVHYTKQNAPYIFYTHTKNVF